MQKILVPTDFSEYAHKALDYAIMLSRKLNAEIILHHGFALPDLKAGAISGLEKMRKVESDYCKEQLEKLANSYPNAHYEHSGEPIRIRPILTDGGPTVDAIADIAKKEDVELIIMGTQGAHGLEKVFIGSVTTVVADRVDIPVLAIPAKSMVLPIEHIVYASQFDPSEADMIHALHEFADKIGAQVTCLHIQSDTSEPASEATTKILKQEGIDLQIRINKSSQEGIKEYIAQEKPDLMVMLTHERSYFESFFNKSLTKEIAYGSTTPLLIFKASKP